MKDNNKAIAQLMNELEGIMSQRIADEVKVAETERQLMQERLQESQRRYRLLTESMADVIWTIDRNLQFTYISPSITRLLGFSVEEAMTLPIDKTFTPASAKVVLNTFLEELSEAKAKPAPDRRWTLALEQYCQDGTTVWVETEMTFLRDRNNQPVGILGVSHDITRRQQTEAALKRYIENLQMKNQEFDLARKQLSTLKVA